MSNRIIKKPFFWFCVTRTVSLIVLCVAIYMWAGEKWEKFKH